MDEEKTEQATPQSRRRARERGQVARSREFTSVFVLLIAFITLYLVINMWGQIATGMLHDILGNLHSPAINEYGVIAINVYVMKVMLAFLWPIFAATSVSAILFNLVQTRGVLSLDPIRPKLNNINPINGLKRMFSMRGLVELIKAITKIAMVVGVTWFYIKANLPSIIQAQTYDPLAYIPFFGEHAFRLGLWIIALFILLAILDFIYQHRQHEKDLMLTKQEAKEEYKQMEGDPLVKSRIRTRQRQIAMTRMLREVPRADVVITNPTRYAIALRYEEDMPAPQVVAKGKGAIAERIIAIAREFDVHIHRDPPLARAIYSMVEVGDLVPYEFYVAMAEILAYVYRTKKKYSRLRKRMAVSGR